MTYSEFIQAWLTCNAVNTPYFCTIKVKDTKYENTRVVSIECEDIRTSTYIEINFVTDTDEKFRLYRYTHSVLDDINSLDDNQIFHLTEMRNVGGNNYIDCSESTSESEHRLFETSLN